jgi:SAM-dependent methyltransferase
MRTPCLFIVRTQCEMHPAGLRIRQITPNRVGWVTGMSASPIKYPVPEDRWKKYLSEYNEGLGLVYERFVLNDYLDRIVSQHNIHTVLEAPLYGMAGVSGINSVRLAQRGCAVTLVDENATRLAAIERIWGELNLRATFVHHKDFSRLPFPDKSFDLAWEWAALWYLPDPEALLKELGRVSRKLIFVAMPNRVQVGYLMRKYLLERDFVNYVDENWADMGRIKQRLRDWGLEIIDEGVLDVPPWPDTVMPAAQVLKRLGIKSKKLGSQFSGSNWNWSTMDYYLGRRPELRAQIDRYTFLEHAPIPWQLKAIWAHHRYVLGKVKSQEAITR